MDRYRCGAWSLRLWRRPNAPSPSRCDCAQKVDLVINQHLVATIEDRQVHLAIGVVEDYAPVSDPAVCRGHPSAQNGSQDRRADLSLCGHLEEQR
uniref:Uncharacterized protein n=1 Tax=Cereibacter sphaeroides (strain ATCC 17025 / ATH 2.4.3) TaxID=349102 RepID=A4WTE7_CERS5